MTDSDSKDKSWFFYLGGGTGSGVLLTVIVGMCVYWKYRKHAQKEARPTSLNVTFTDPENLNVLHTKRGATRSFEATDLGQEAFGIQGLDRPISVFTGNGIVNRRVLKGIYLIMISVSIVRYKSQKIFDYFYELMLTSYTV